MLEGVECPEQIRKRHPIEISEEFQWLEVLCLDYLNFNLNVYIAIENGHL